MKSLLFSKGFSLYKEIWSDQPPLLTLILSFWFKLFGFSVYWARILILIFSSIFLWAFYQTIKISKGAFCASLAVIFLILSTEYTLLSVSVMIGIPALSFAMLSILFLKHYKKYLSKYLLILSGIFMALSLQTKFFTSFLIPIILFEIIHDKQLYLKKERGKILPPAILWLSSLLIVYIFIALSFFRFDLQLFIQSLFQPHLLKSAFVGFRYSFLSKFTMILNDYEIIIFAFIGIFLIIKQKKRELLFPFLWSAFALILLLNHRPIWKHHYLLISIPLSWLAAIGLSQTLCIKIKNKNLLKTTFSNKLKIFFRCLAKGVLIALIGLKLSAKYNKIHTSLWNKTTTGEKRAIELLLKYKKDTRWMFTDRPIFAFYTNILVPPELAVFSTKRRLIDNLTPDYLISVLSKYEPEQILLGRFKNYPPKLLSYIKKHYLQTHTCEIQQQEQILSYIVWPSKQIRFGSYRKIYKFPALYKEYRTPFAKKIKIFLRKNIAKLHENPLSP